MTHRSALLKITAVISIGLLTGCASLTYQQDVPRQAYVTSGSDDFSRHMPIVIGENTSHSYNQIGRPQIVEEEGKIRLKINTDLAAVYTEKRYFKTKNNNQYTNLIYRFHFEKVPFSLLPFNLTTGKNVGLIFVITLNEQQQPVLITTVHTCGCYLAIVPTNYLQEDAYPEKWDLNSQDVFGASLPGILKFGDSESDEKVVVYLQDETHRVIHLDVAKHRDLADQYPLRQLLIKPINDLDTFKLSDSSQPISMFETSGSRQGYVRDSYKPLELLLMSWWSMDIRVGVDKRYGKAGDESPVFYTSIKPWAQKASDMRDFSSFLDYWGWRL